MATDIVAKITELVGKIQKDPKLVENFQKDPIATVEKLLGIDLPDEQLGKIVDGIKAKLVADKAGDLLGSLLGKK